MTDYFIDFETRSQVSIRDGIDAYFTRAEATICTMAVGSGPVKLWDILADPQPLWFTQAVQDPTATFIACNFAFDRGVMERLLRIPTRVNQWLCVRAQANAHGLPGGLAGACAAVGVPAEHAKMADGKRLIQIFCVPKKDGAYNEPQDFPDEWCAFKNYAMRDIDAPRSLYRRLPTHNFTGANLRYFWLDARINERGFAIDVPLIESAAKLLNSAKAKGDVAITTATGGAVTAVTQRNRLLAYLKSKGLDLPNLKKAELETLLQSDSISPEHRFVIEARLEGSRASGAKYKRALTDNVGGRIRYTQQFSGAGRTGRTAHKGFQPGNMPRPSTYNPLAENLADQHVACSAEFIDGVILPAIRNGTALDSFELTGGPNTACALALRHCIIAEPGNELTCADYKNIESRVLAWIAGEDWKLLAYEAADRGEGQDAYKLLYSQFFGVSTEKVSENERQAGKVVELSCGFGGSVGAFVAMATVYGIDLNTLSILVLPNANPAAISKAESAWWRAFLQREDFNLEPEVYMACHVLVQAYRTANPRIDSLKKAIGRAVESAIRIRGSFYEVGRCKIWADASVLLVELPSGYRLCYWSPEIESEEVADPETGEKETRSYMTFLRARGARMIRERSWSGLLLENVVQAVANQVFRYGKLEIDALYPDTLVLGVHDEAVAEAAIGAINLEKYIAAMCRGWHWTRGLPLAADGWQGPRYGKRKGA